MIRVTSTMVCVLFLSPAWPQPLAAPAADAVRWQRVFPKLQFDNPLFLTAAPGEAKSLYVATQSGRIFVFENQLDPASAREFLDLRGRVRSGGEEGLLGLAFHPQFAKNQTFYVYYTAAGKPRRSIVSKFRAFTPQAADPASEQKLLEIGQPYSNHNGGMLAFGPDGMLYIASGDGGGSGDPHNNGQRLDTLLGKILRLTPEGKIPGDNPFVKTSGARGEIWAYGLRNPWRFSFDRKTGALWAGDVGQNQFEEVDWVVKGGNYGWRLFEGEQEFNNPEDLPKTGFLGPVHTYGRSAGVSITGGYVYRGGAIPALQGAYIYGDFGSGKVWALSFDGKRLLWNREIGEAPYISSFGEDAAGELYLTSFDGGIYRLVQTP